MYLEWGSQAQHNGLFAFRKQVKDLHCEHATVDHVAFLQINKLVEGLKKEYYVNLMAYICFKYVLLPKTDLAVLVIHSY